MRHVRLLPGARLDARRNTLLIGALLVLLIVLTALGAGALLQRRALDDWRRQLENLSLILAESTAQTLNSAYLVLDTMAVDVRRSGAYDEATLRERLGDLKTHLGLRDKISGLPQIDVASVVGADGTLINFSRSFPTPPINLAERDYFVQRRADPNLGVFISAPVRNKGNGKWTFYISRRLNGRDGAFIGMLLVGISCDYIADFYKTIILDGDASFSLYRRDYTLLARWPVVESMMGQPNRSGSSYQVGESGARHAVLITSSPRMAAQDRPVTRMGAVRLLERYPLIVNVTITEDLYLSGWRGTMRLIGAIALGSCAGVIGAFALVLRLLARREQDAQRALALQSEAEAANRIKTDFLATMSHEIRTPMHGILGMSELLRESALSAPQQTYADQIHGGASALMHIINEVLDLSKIESGRLELDIVPFRPLLVLRDTISLHAANAARKQLTIVLHSDVRPDFTVRGDPVRLGQILGNLLDNAIKFSHAGDIVISCAVRAAANAPDQLRLDFAVRDRGIGISRETQARLFVPFIQANQSVSRDYGGSGLGLAICKQLVELMGGAIDVAGRLGKGTTFSFFVRCQACVQGERSAPVAPPRHTPAPPSPAAQSDGAAPSKARILLVEDGEINRQLVHLLLAKLGLVADEAVNGIEALDALERSHYELVLMDCMMPLMDGYETTARLRARELRDGLARVPVLALTASAIEGDRERCLAAGMDDYLSKPFSSQQFRAALTRWIVLNEPA